MTVVNIRAEHVTKSFTRGGVTTTPVADLDVTVHAGEVVAISGPTLTGKTTLLHLLAGWAEPDSGSVDWPGASGRPPPWHELTVIPQTLTLLDELTVGENVGLPLRARRSGVDDGALDELLEALDIIRLRHRNPDEISVGERQRATVARALVTRARTILADEPVAHQDQGHADVILGLLRTASAAGAACVIATRDPAVAATADRVVELPWSGPASIR